MLRGEEPEEVVPGGVDEDLLGGALVEPRLDDLPDDAEEPPRVADVEGAEPLRVVLLHLSLIHI